MNFASIHTLHTRMSAGARDFLHYQKGDDLCRAPSVCSV